MFEASIDLDLKNSAIRVLTRRATTSEGARDDLARASIDARLRIAEGLGLKLEKSAMMRIHPGPRIMLFFRNQYFTALKYKCVARL